MTRSDRAPAPVPPAPGPAQRSWGGRVIFQMVLIACAAILLWSGFGKLRSPADARDFVQVVFPAVTDPAAAGVVTVVSVAELLLAAWLIAGLLTTRAMPRSALLVFAVLMLAMAAMLAVALSRGFEGSCGCFGSGGAGASTAVLRTACLAIIAAMGIAYAPKAEG